MLGKVMAIIGCLTQLAPVVGLSMTIYQAGGILLEQSLERVLALGEILEIFGAAMGPTLWSSAISIVGYLPLCLALYVYKYRAPWFYWSLVIIAANIIVLFPFGTIMASAIGHHCYKHRDEHQMRVQTP